MRFFIGVIFLFLMSIFCACKDASEQPPVPLDTMRSIMLDIHTAEYYSQYKNNDQSRQQKNMDSLAVYYSSIFKHYNLTFEAYKEAFAWYTAHPQMLDSLYAGVITKAEALKKEFPDKRPQHEIDSVKRVGDTLRTPEERKKDSAQAIIKRVTDSLSRK